MKRNNFGQIYPDIFQVAKNNTILGLSHTDAEGGIWFPSAYISTAKKQIATK